LLLQGYGEGLLTEPAGTTGGNLPNIMGVRQILVSLKVDLQKRGGASELFAHERDEASGTFCQFGTNDIWQSLLSRDREQSLSSVVFCYQGSSPVGRE
jgi:hypothetical protein